VSAKVGRPRNLASLAARAVRRHGAGWVADLERQASLGDVAAIQALLELARPARRRGEASDEPPDAA
jgi:hypothetical protein